MAGGDIIGRLSEAGIQCGYVGQGRYFTFKDLRRFVLGEVLMKVTGQEYET